MNKAFIIVPVILLGIMVAPSLTNAVSYRVHAQTQQLPQQPQYQPGQQLPQPNQGQQQLPQQQYPYQFPRSSQQQPQYQQPSQPPTANFQSQQPPAGYGMLMNESKVMGCLNHVLGDSIMKASSLTIQNNLSKTITLGVKQAFVTNATQTLDACIMPRSR
jgi:hypothetical protein